MTSAMAFGLIAVSNSVVEIMFGSAFKKSAIILSFSAPTLLFMGWSNVMRTQYIIPHKKDDIYIKSTLFGAIINLVINAILIPRYLAIGAAIATLTAELFVPFYQFLRLKKEIDYRRHLSNVIPYIVIGALMAIILKLIEQFMGISMLTLVVQIIVGGIVYIMCSLIYIIKFDNEMLQFIMATFKTRKR